MKNVIESYLKEKINVNYNVYYYIANSIVNEVLKEKFEEKLSSIEQVKYKKYLKIEDRDMFLCSRIILKEEFERIYKTECNYEFSYNEYQKPFLVNYPDFHFNISHSEGQVMIGFSKYQVGVDIEKLVSFDKKTMIEMARIVFNESEVDLLVRLDEKKGRYLFTKLWTLKESFIKAIGTGFSCDTKAICFDDIEKLTQSVQEIDGQVVHSYFSIFNETYMTAISYITNN